ncbi:preprotein translocase subunit SecE [Candidatus Parcubacteria bacterium]|nr:preprotein translocase subunit SecE [Candidatus Parcubacteria bacterium]
MFEFFKKVKGEMTHTVWPTRNQTIAFTAIVIVISIAIAYYLGLFDYIFSQILGSLI